MINLLYEFKKTYIIINEVRLIWIILRKKKTS